MRPHTTPEVHVEKNEAATIITIQGFRGFDYVAALNEIGAASGRAATLKRLIYIGDEAPAGFMPYASLHELANQIDEPAFERRYRAVSPDDVINTQYTSGTTGFPKGVMLSSRGIVNNAWAVGQRLGFTPADLVRGAVHAGPSADSGGFCSCTGLPR